MRDADKTRRGIILVVVLLVLAVLSIMAAASIEISHTEQFIARNIVAQARANALAEVGITEAIIALINRSSGDRWLLDGTPRMVSFGNAKIEISIQDELGKIDLNVVPDEALKNLFLSVGLDLNDADADVDALGDWRDTDDLKRLHGAEKDDYLAAGYSYGPRNGAFESIAELEQVKGFSRDLVNRLRSALTIYARRPFPDITSAPSDVLLAFAGMDKDQVVSLLATRHASSNQDSQGQAPTGGTTASLPDLTGRAFTLIARTKTESGAVVSRTVVVRFTGGSDRPYWILKWQ